MVEPKPVAGIVILNWNGLSLTKKCLSSLDQQSYKNFQTVVIDNGSTDGSVNWLKSKENLKLIVNKQNLGFARAMNQGISEAIETGCKYVVALNNDTVLDPDWLRYLVEFMDSHPEIGFAQGASMQQDNKSLFDSTGIYLEEGFIPNQRALGGKDPKTDIVAIGPNAAGAIYRSSMLKATAISANSYMDSRFFAYVEDVDLNLRCTLRGYKFAFVPKAVLFHAGSITGNKVASKKMFWGSRNLVWLVYKNVPLPVLRKKFKKILVSHLANLQYLWREQRDSFLPYWAGLVVGTLGIPLFWKSRRTNLKKQNLSKSAFLALLVPSNPPLYNPVRKLFNLVK